MHSYTVEKLKILHSSLTQSLYICSQNILLMEFFQQVHNKIASGIHIFNTNEVRKLSHIWPLSVDFEFIFTKSSRDFAKRKKNCL